MWIVYASSEADPSVAERQRPLPAVCWHLDFGNKQFGPRGKTNTVIPTLTPNRQIPITNLSSIFWVWKPSLSLSQLLSCGAATQATLGSSPPPLLCRRPSTPTRRRSNTAQHWKRTSKSPPPTRDNPTSFHCNTHELVWSFSLSLSLS